MSVSVFVVALLLVAGVQSLPVSKATWDHMKAQVAKDQEAFIAKHGSDNANALRMIGDVWAAIAKYDNAIGDKAGGKAIMDGAKVLDEEIAGVKISKEEEDEYLAESDDLVDDVADGLAIEKALIDYIVKKEPGKTADLKAVFEKIKSEVEDKE